MIGEGSNSQTSRAWSAGAGVLIDQAADVDAAKAALTRMLTVVGE